MWSEIEVISQVPSPLLRDNEQQQVQIPPGYPDQSVRHHPISLGSTDSRTTASVRSKSTQGYLCLPHSERHA